ncbi:MAG TPA: electron transfer flavoprotein subunit beta/FixA family protein, partial [Spirochaetia bacterium]|nr:electron transfer flavoprotein subunit beta/FixA family protein [Spirochaetia bacterium]
MKIIVTLKHVPETGAVALDETTGTMKREGVESIPNPLDLYAVEAALRLRERYGGTITALSMGPAGADRSLREVIAMGCDDAVLVTGREFAGSDTLATSRALSRAIGRLGGCDLVISGERATDGDTGQVGPGTAALLDVPLAAYVST